MSGTVILVVGIVVFAISVFGVVMAGGLLMTRDTINNDPQHRRRVDENQLDATLPTSAKF